MATESDELRILRNEQTPASEWAENLEMISQSEATNAAKEKAKRDLLRAELSKITDPYYTVLLGEARDALAKKTARRRELFWPNRLQVLLPYATRINDQPVQMDGALNFTRKGQYDVSLEELIVRIFDPGVKDNYAVLSLSFDKFEMIRIMLEMANNSFNRRNARGLIGKIGEGDLSRIAKGAYTLPANFRPDDNPPPGIEIILTDNSGMPRLLAPRVNFHSRFDLASQSYTPPPEDFKNLVKATLKLSPIGK